MHYTTQLLLSEKLSSKKNAARRLTHLQDKKHLCPQLPLVTLMVDMGSNNYCTSKQQRFLLSTRFHFSLTHQS